MLSGAVMASEVTSYLRGCQDTWQAGALLYFDVIKSYIEANISFEFFYSGVTSMGVTVTGSCGASYAITASSGSLSYVEAFIAGLKDPDTAKADPTGFAQAVVRDCVGVVTLDSVSGYIGVGPSVMSGYSAAQVDDISGEDMDGCWLAICNAIVKGVCAMEVAPIVTSHSPSSSTGTSTLVSVS